MRKTGFALVLTLAALPAWAQATTENIAACRSDDDDVAIAGCTALIQSGMAAVLGPSYVYRAGAYADKGLFDQAIADNTTAITLDPANTDAIYNRGVDYLKEGKRDLAIADFRKALALDPTDSDAKDHLTALGVAP